MVKKALVVGINYLGTGHALQGCINDAQHMKNMLTREGFVVEQILETTATTANIKAGLERLVAGTTPGDVIVFHYSGHGSQLPSTVEADGYEEIICPVDLDWNTKVIKDDDLRTIFNKAPEGVNVTLILDCCHSGDALDQVVQTSPVTQTRLVFDQSNDRYLPPPIIAVQQQLRTRSSVPFSTERDVNATAVLIAGCRSDQTSADAFIDGIYQGAATAALLAAFNKNRNITYKQLIDQMNASMVAGKYEQQPQLDGATALHNQVFLKPWKITEVDIPVDIPLIASIPAPIIEDVPAERSLNIMWVAVVVVAAVLLAIL